MNSTLYISLTGWSHLISYHGIGVTSISGNHSCNRSLHGIKKNNEHVYFDTNEVKVYKFVPRLATQISLKE